MNCLEKKAGESTQNFELYQWESMLSVRVTTADTGNMLLQMGSESAYSCGDAPGNHGSFIE